MWEIVQSVWRAVLEILILTVGIYSAFRFVRGTRGAPVVTGFLVVLLTLVMASYLLKLTVLQYFLPSISAFFVLAVLVIFQPELRRALAQLGQFGKHQENIEAIDEIVKAALGLSKKRIGALIAIERETGLRSYIETGTTVDAEVTAFLLTSIFLPQSPLHDGAAIIERGRLVAAACVLPLPQEEKDLPKYMGMRHRAAVGISEETDAVCVVVSEETGNISVASDGKLRYELDEDNLKDILKSMFSRPKKKAKRE